MTDLKDAGQSDTVQLDNVPWELAELDRWVVWRYEVKGNGKPAKVPYNAKTGNRASVSNPEDWCSFVDAVEASRDSHYSGLGIVFVAEDSVCGVDIDHCRNENGILTPEAVNIVRAIGSYAEVSPSGNGIKIFCRGRVDLETGRRCKIDDRQNLELYTSGRYFTFTGQGLPNISTNLSDASDALENIVSKYLDTKQPQPAKRAGKRPINAVQRAERYAETMAPAVSGEDGHGRTFHVCCKLLNGFDLTETELWPILDKWNTRCDPPWTTKELEHKVAEAVKVGTQEQRGYMYADDLQTIETGVAEFHQWYTSDDKHWLEKHTFPEHLIPTTGLLRQICDYINAHSYRTQPVLAMSAAISLVALAVARRVCDEMQTYTNLYIVNLAGTGEGKSTPQNAIKDIIGKVNVELLERIGEEATSDTAIEYDLARHSSMLYLKDEYGSEWRGQSKAPWLHSVNSLLMKLWERAGNYHKTKTKSDERKTRILSQPNCSLSGWATPRMFWPTVTDDNLTDGFLARILLFDMTDMPSELNEQQAFVDIPEELVDQVRYWFNYGGEFSFDPDEAPDKIQPFVVKRTKEARKLFRAAQTKCENYRDPAQEMEFGIWKRMPEKAARLSIVSAVSRATNVTDLQVNEDDMAWGIAIAEWCSASLITRSKQFAGGHTTRERQLDQVLQVIRTAFKQKKNLTKTELRKRTRGIRNNDFRDIISQLEEMEQISVESVKNSGRPTTIYKPLLP